MSHIDISGCSASERLHRRNAAYRLLIADRRLVEARQAERNALLYTHIAIVALLLSIALVVWAIWA